MIRLTEIKLPLAHPDTAIADAVVRTLGIQANELQSVHIFKLSFDARKADLLQVYIVDVILATPELETAVLLRHADNPHVRPTPDMAYKPVATAPAQVENSQSQRPVVVGFGPCGIFAALVLAQMGFKPIVLERGKKVRERTKDTWGLWRKNQLHPESNVQFGEGGAGTFSDGKLYSQIKDPRHLGRKVMQEFVQAGAPEEILVDAHPHIGTFKLVKVVENLRAQIIALGGEVRFEQRVTDVQIENGPLGGQLQGLTVLDLATQQSYELPTRQAVLALGHSARDTFTMLFERGVYMEAKPFSIGFRIEHPQSLIDRARWGRHAGHPLLGAADYKLVHHAKNGRAVYSFCMCPGGTVVAATSEVGRVVTNGMSQYSRNERNANAGIVVGITPEDFPTDAATFAATLGTVNTAKSAAQAVHPLAGIALQRTLESQAYLLGGSTYEAPGQLVGDFVKTRASTALGSVEPSYKPGVKLGDLASSLPSYAIEAIREAIPAFG
ncbi:MAG: FAD-dependent protein, partial [Burkholderiaceae bacterium]